MSDDVKIILSVAGLFLAMMVGVMLVVGGLNYSLDHVPVSVLVEGKEVFRGRSACVDIKSSGSTTRVDVAGGLLCIFPRAYYVSQHVEVKTLKAEELQ